MEADRRNFMKASVMALGGFVLPGPSVSKKVQIDMQEDPMPLDRDLVRDFVRYCHGDFAKVQALYQEEPKLIYVSHDWKNGDFESGIEAAGHMGNREIAQFLMDRGARINFFTLCMLGKTPIVSAMLNQFPWLLNAKGPHGFTPLHHAIQGGSASEEVRQLLVSLGATETFIKL